MYTQLMDDLRTATASETTQVADLFPAQPGEELFSSALHNDMDWAAGKAAMEAWNPEARCLGEINVDGETRTYFWAKVN